MKKIVSAALRVSAVILTVLLILSSCADEDTSKDSTDGANDVAVASCSIAYVRDYASGQAVKQDSSALGALSELCAEINAEMKEYKTAEDSDASRKEAVAAAVSGGAKLVVCSGYFMYCTVLDVQDDYTNVSFLVVGAPRPTPELGEILSERVHTVTFSEEDAGYAAGYCAVYGGALRPAFEAFADVESTVRAFAGFVSGVSDAAGDLGIESIPVVCSCANAFEYFEDEEGRTLTSSEVSCMKLFEAGCDVIAALGGEVYTAIDAASQSGGKVISICYEVDRDSPSLLTSPYYDCGAAVRSAVGRFIENGSAWGVRDAGENSVVGIFEGCVATDGPVNDIIKDKFKDGKRIDIPNTLEEVGAECVDITYFDPEN